MVYTGNEGREALTRNTGATGRQQMVGLGRSLGACDTHETDRQHILNHTPVSNHAQTIETMHPLVEAYGTHFLWRREVYVSH